MFSALRSDIERWRIGRGGRCVGALRHLRYCIAGLVASGALVGLKFLKLLTQNFFDGLRLAQFVEGKKKRFSENAGDDGENGDGLFPRGTLKNNGVQFVHAANDLR